MDRNWLFGLNRQSLVKPHEDRDHPIHRRYRQGSIFPYEISARAEIAAPIDVAWQALVDFEHYGEWNTFTPKVKTDLEVGSPVQLHVVMPRRSSSVRTECLNLVEPGKIICWGMHLGHPLLLCANRWQILNELDNGRTQYLTVDKVSGLLVPLLLALYGRPMRLGFQSVADNLKHWVESKRV